MLIRRPPFLAAVLFSTLLGPLGQAANLDVCNAYLENFTVSSRGRIQLLAGSESKIVEVKSHERRKLIFRRTSDNRTFATYLVFLNARGLPQGVQDLEYGSSYPQVGDGSRETKFRYDSDGNCHIEYSGSLRQAAKGRLVTAWDFSPVACEKLGDLYSGPSPQLASCYGVVRNDDPPRMRSVAEVEAVPASQYGVTSAEPESLVNACTGPGVDHEVLGVFATSGATGILQNQVRNGDLSQGYSGPLSGYAANWYRASCQGTGATLAINQERNARRPAAASARVSVAVSSSSETGVMRSGVSEHQP